MASNAAQTISSGLEKLQQTLNGSAEGQKVVDLARDTRDYHDPSNRLTTDYGVKQNNTGGY
jgi:catalase